MRGGEPGIATRIGGLKAACAPGGKVGAKPISERRIKSERRKAAIAAALHADDPAFAGDGLRYLQSIYRDAQKDEQVRIMAAYRAARFETAPIKPGEAPEAKSSFDTSLLSADEQRLLAKLLLKSTGQAPIGPAEPPRPGGGGVVQRNQAPAVIVEPAPQPRSESTAEHRAEYARLMAEMFRRDPVEAQRWLAQHGPLPD